MKNYIIEIKWGIIFFTVSLLWMYFEKAMGWHDTLISDHAIYTNFFGLFALAIYLFAIYDKRKNYFQGKMTWKQGFVSGVILTIVVTILSPLGQYITHKFITPDYLDNMISYTTQNGRMNKEEAQAYFNLQSYIIQSVAGALMMGVVTSAIVGLILKRK
ncbi:DUF4199 domain-containing protein [Salegentibacter sp. F14]